MEDPIDDAVLSDDDVVLLRRMLPATDAGAYLNTGTAGPLPTPAVDAMRDELEVQLRLPRSGPEHLDRYLALAAEDRSAIASLLNTQPSEIALTHSTTEGMSLVTMGIGWQSGDEAVTTTLEHPGVLFPLYVARDRFGAEIRRLDLEGLSDSEIVEAFAGALSPRTRLVSISHVSFQNGQVLPIRAIANAIGGDRALLLVDGAQSYGALDVDVSAIGADAYAVPGQKWQLGPEGTGGLYCRPEVVEDLSVMMASYGTVESYSASDFVPHRDARRLEFGTTNTIGWVGQIAAISFLRETVGLDRASTRAVGLAHSAIERLDEIDGVRVLTPPDRHATLVTFTIEGVDAVSAVERLADRGINGRSISELGAIRFSVAFFTTTEEIDRTITEVEAIARADQ